MNKKIIGTLAAAALAVGGLLSRKDLGNTKNDNASFKWV